MRPRISLRIALLILAIPASPLPVTAGECPKEIFAQALKSYFQKPAPVIDPPKPVLTAVSAEVKSVWGRSDEVRRINAGAGQLEFRRVGSEAEVVPVAAKSLAFDQPQLLAVLDDLRLYSAPFDAFRKAYRIQHGSEVTVLAIRKYYESRLALLTSGFDEFCGLIKQRNPALAKATHAALFEDLHKWEQRLATARKPSDVADAAASIDRRVRSKIFELQVGVSTPDVKGLGVYLAEAPEFIKHIDGEIHRHQARALMQEDYLKKLRQEFPLILENPRVQGRLRAAQKRRDKLHAAAPHPGDEELFDLTTDELFLSIRGWIEDKEIDVLRVENGRYKWVELKRNAKPLTLSDFSRAAGGGKSNLQQLRENLEVLKFLKMDQLVDLEFRALNGVTDEVARELERLGVKLVR